MQRLERGERMRVRVEHVYICRDCNCGHSTGVHYRSTKNSRAHGIKLLRPFLMPFHHECCSRYGMSEVEWPAASG